MADGDELKEAKDAFAAAQDAENDNRTAYEADIRFARHEEQWPEKIRKDRERRGKPVLTISKMNAFIRQVVNDARQNKPSIKVHPADSGADVETAEVINGLIRNIEYTSNADVAYDTATECAVSGGFGYIRVGADYAYGDSFDMDLQIKRVANPLSVYGDPNSTEADSSDWLDAFVVERLSQGQFKARYGEKTESYRSWDDSSAWGDAIWREGPEIMVAERWKRRETDQKVSQFTMNGKVFTFSDEQIERSPDLKAAIESGLYEFKRARVGKTFKVKQMFMTGAEILETVEWAGCYIPIVPVYGDEYNIKGKRYFRSLIHSGVDSQRNFNYWRSAATELVALAPRVPFIGRKGAFDTDQERWQTVNIENHPFLEYDGPEAPQRQPLDSGPAAGALQEALNASDDMKAVIGLYDASLGARSNETSGKAILARQREGDVSTFHFIDNMSRAIRHTGRILIDLIPHYYSEERVVRIMGEDGKPENRPINQSYPKTDPKSGEQMQQPVTGPNGGPMDDEAGEPIMEPVMAMHDLSVGKYDLTVTTGPSYTTRREEAAAQMTELMRAFPPAAPIVGPELAKNLDWPGADKIAEKLDAMTNPQQPQIPPELQQKIEEGQQLIQQQADEIKQLKADQSAQMAKVEADKRQGLIKISSDEEIEREKIASNERIAHTKIASEAAIAARRNAMQAQQPSPGAN